jgi:DNA-binding ferritin-like protein
MKKLNILHDIGERLKGIDNNISKFLEKFYQSTIINEIRQEDLRKYESIKEILNNEMLFTQIDKSFIKDLRELIGAWCPSTADLYYDVIHARAQVLGRPIENSREYYAYITQYLR